MWLGTLPVSSWNCTRSASKCHENTNFINKPKKVWNSQLSLEYLDFVRRDLHNELSSVDVFTMISISTVTCPYGLSARRAELHGSSLRPHDQFLNPQKLSRHIRLLKELTVHHLPTGIPHFMQSFIKFSQTPATGPYPEPDNSHTQSL